MGRPTKSDQLIKVHSLALERFNTVESALREEREQCLMDRRFYSIAGAQWEGNLGEQFANKPKLEVNKVHLSVIRIINEYRNNRITADFVPKNGAKSDELADTCDGLFRADEVDSGAEEAYDNAFEEAVGGGFGAIRLRAEYEDEEDPDNEYQRIRIEPILDADTCVFFDLDAKRQDKADAKYCFVLNFMSKEAFMDEWGDDPSTWPKSISKAEFDWAPADTVVVAEYYVIEQGSDVAMLFRGIAGDERRVLQSELEDSETLAEELRVTGYVEDADRRKKIKTRRVHKYIMSGKEVLEDAGFIAGKHIPIVPVYGKRWVVDGVERCMGHVRLAKDPQRLKNMQLSKLAEQTASASYEKPILTPEQVAGHVDMWSKDNIDNYPYLLINPITDKDGNPMPAAPLGYTHPPALAPAQAALLQLTEQDMQDILGNPQQAEKMVANISGEAVELIQDRMDMQTYIYVSNFAKGVRRVGEIWLSMAKELYVEHEREMKTLNSSDEPSSIVIGTPVKNAQTGAVENGYDLSRANFDVAVDVGPSSSSKRKATVRSLLGMARFATDPETQQVLSSMLMMNMEGEGISEARSYFRKRLVQMGMLKPTPEEQKELEEAAKAAENKPDPNLMLASAMAEEAKAKAQKAQADAMATLADVEKTRAETLEILASIQAQARELALKNAQALAAVPSATSIPPTNPGA